MEEVEDASGGYDDSLDYAILTTLMRIYDVLATDLTQRDPQTAKVLLEAHARGDIFTALPTYTGRHILNEENEASDESDDTFD